MTGTTRFDAAEYLDTAERQAAYITAALETGDRPSCEMRSESWHGHAAWQRSQSLYTALSKTGNPEFGTVMRAMHALGLRLSAHPPETRRTPKKRRAA